MLLIAETHSQSLADRWYQFDRCAFKGADGHSGGRTFYRLYTNGLNAVVPGWLFLSFTTVPATEEDAKRYTSDVKSILLAKYEERHGLLPSCNTHGPFGAEPKPVALSASSTIADTTVPKSIVEPRRMFSGWIPWTERKKLPGGEFAGIYAIARFDGMPPSDSDVLDQRVVYIGETCDNSLLGRLSQFNRSAFNGKDGHSGGWTYRARFGDESNCLYVAVCPVEDLAEPHRSAFIRWAERQSLWDYVKLWGRRPDCNSK